jgi:hypothetical protein
VIVPVTRNPGDLARHLLFVTTPALWPAWPFLPVVRHARGVTDLGLVFDARGACGLTGYSATVFACNLFALPPTLDQFLALPKEVFDGGEELLADGWRVD